MNSIPPEINEVFEELKSEITWLHGRWVVYRQLFAESQKRFDLLNASASSFFFLLQYVLLSDVQITLSKLTDPAKTGKFENLSLKQVQERLEAHADAALAVRVRSILDQLHEKCEPFRLWRNKRLAHADLTTAMKSSPNPLPGISRSMIEAALELIRMYMNEIELYYFNSKTSYEHFIMSTDGDTLVTILRYGMHYKELLKDGSVSFDDWNNSKWRDA